MEATNIKNRIVFFVKKYWIAIVLAVVVMGVVIAGIVSSNAEKRRIASILEHNENVVVKVIKENHEVKTQLKYDEIVANISLSDVYEETEVNYYDKDHKLINKDYVMTFDNLNPISITIELNHSVGVVSKSVNFNSVDTTAPVLEGIEDYEVGEGDEVDYKEPVTVSDNFDEEVEILFEGEVDFDTPGTYVIRVSAKDSSNNSIEDEITITVEEKVVYVAPPVATPQANNPEPSPGGTVTNNEELLSQVDAILASITHDGMSASAKASAVYYWMKGNVSYRAGAGNGLSIEQNAINMMNRRRGQCEEYAALAYVMMDRLGIPVQYIQGEGQASGGPGTYTYHVWIRVNTTGSYLHFDPMFGQRWPDHEFDQLTFNWVTLLTSHRWDHSVYGA